MYFNEVLTLLVKHFGEPRNSKILTSRRKSTSKSLYFYTIEDTDRIFDICKALSSEFSKKNATFPDVYQELSSDDKQEKPLCVCLKKDGEHWIARFFYIEKIQYKAYRKQFAASVILSRPFVSLSDTDGASFYGYWKSGSSSKKHEREGLSYWVNKALFFLPKFRSFSCDFFNEVGMKEKKSILIDVARTIKSCGFFLPEVSFCQLVKAQTPEDLIRSIAKSENLNINFDININTVDLNLSFIMLRLSEIVDRKDLLKTIKEIPISDLASLIWLKDFWDGFSSAEFVKKFYSKTLSKYSDVRMYASDYVDMATQTGYPIRVSLDYNSLIRAHDQLSIKIRKQAAEKEILLDNDLVRSPSRFDDLQSKINERDLSGEFERIRTKQRLYEEGEHQHNCVFSRRDRIRRDEISIFHWDHNAKEYTVQISMNADGYFVEEIRSRFNQPATEEDLQYLQGLLQGICQVDTAVSPLPPAHDLWRMFLELE